MRLIFAAVSLCLTLGLAQAQTIPAANAGPENKSSSDEESAWQEFTKTLQPVSPPASWQQSQPSQEEIDKFKASEAERITKAADKAKQFQAKFPKSSHAPEASTKEYELLQVAVQLGNTNALPRVEAIEAARLKDPNTSENDQVQARLAAINRNAMSHLPADRPAAFDALEKGARALQKDFPKRPESYEMLMAVAGEASSDKAIQLAKELSEGAAPDQVKEAAKALLKKMERVGKPLPVKFTAVDGRAVDLTKLKGKVVLVDFWATWCVPCVRALPDVRAAYDKLHPKGFEIVGISFDSDKAKLTGFVQEQKMTWPQYFDGKQWENDYGKEFGIQSIPTMWLVDKKGNLRDMNGREDLAGKVEKLLAENP